MSTGKNVKGKTKRKSKESKNETPVLEHGDMDDLEEADDIEGMWDDAGDSDTSDSDGETEGEGEGMEEGEEPPSGTGDKEENGKKSDSKTKKNKLEERVYLPSGKDGDSDVELEMDPAAYKMYHALEVGAPCLSFDIFKDSLGDDRSQFPMTMYLVAGTQVSKPATNAIILLKLSGMGPTRQRDGSDSESEDEMYEDSEPRLDHISIKHSGGVSRLRIAPLLPEKKLVAAWSDSGVVNIWDVSKHAASLDTPRQGASKQPHNDQPLFSFSGHQIEGFGLDWSPLVPGRLATGDCRKNIHVWEPHDGGAWRVNQQPFVGHTQSVEDLQWSPNEGTVFASCSVDKTIRIWDIREAPGKACKLSAVAHDSDVNVISWNRMDPVIVSGGDDGAVKIWDLRQFHSGKTLAMFKYHTGPITSVEWHPTDSTVFASSGEDNQILQWDLAVEEDTEKQKQTQDRGDDDTASGSHDPNRPPQLLFSHLGLKEVKEVHWHRQIPGVLVSTAASGFNVFRTISV